MSLRSVLSRLFSGGYRPTYPTTHFSDSSYNGSEGGGPGSWATTSGSSVFGDCDCPACQNDCDCPACENDCDCAACESGS